MARAPSASPFSPGIMSLPGIISPPREENATSKDETGMPYPGYHGRQGVTGSEFNRNVSGATVSNSPRRIIEAGDNSEINRGPASPPKRTPSPPRSEPSQNSDREIRQTKFGLQKWEACWEDAERSIPCIYGIPDELRAQKESAYKPRVVSIGPIHSNDERLNANLHIKLNYRDSLCSRARGDETTELCTTAMNERVANVENCYAEKAKLMIDGKMDSLAGMMFTDGCFILELLYRFYSLGKKLLKRSIHDPVLGSPMKLLAIRHDLLLLENQIPFFVLEKLFSFTIECIPDRPHNVSLTDYVLFFFGNNFSFRKDNLKKEVNTSDYHILHLLHQCYRPNDDPWEGKGDEDEIEFSKKKFRFPSASDLDLTGVEFVAGTGEDMFNVKFIKPRGLLRCFQRARFEIPTLSIYYDTEPLLRNLIAFEQCCLAVPHYMTSYGFFMDTLINSAEDVKLLENAEILHNDLGTSEEASDLFNNICKEVVVGRFYFEETCELAANHCQELWPRFMASLRRDYFANPWTGIAVFAAICIFGLTIVQTFYTVAPFYKK